MKILVLGAAGFVGRAVVSAAAERFGAGMIVAGVHSAGTRPFSEAVEVRTVEATDEVSLARAIEGVTHVVNCVATSDEKMVMASRALAEVAGRQTLQRVVHISSIAIYGDLDGDIVETDLGQNLDGYGLAKKACEDLVTGMAASRVETVILRPAIIYGPESDQWTGRLARLLAQGRLGDLGAAGEGLCQLVYIDDVAAATVMAIDAPGAAGATFNLAAPKSRTWNRYLIDLARAVHVRPVEISATRLKLERTLFAYPLKAADLILRRLGLRAPDAITPSLARLFARRARYGGAAAALLLPNGWTDYETGVALSARWARTEVLGQPA
jgi:nucleoside-diphosphate-sugar epimerase